MTASKHSDHQEGGRHDQQLRGRASRIGDTDHVTQKIEGEALDRANAGQKEQTVHDPPNERPPAASFVTDTHPSAQIDAHKDRASHRRKRRQADDDHLGTLSCA